MTEPSVAWPLTPDQRQQVTRLGELVRRFGAARFLEQRLVRADARDFPDRWERTIPAVRRLLHRLCWHAYLDPEITVEDDREPEAPGHTLLTSSAIELVAAAGGALTFRVARIGNDDVAGELVHLVGSGFLQLAPGVPFREVEVVPTEAEGSIAACYLGFGVLVANSAMYRRFAAERVTTIRTEEYIESAGGLSVVDATLLVAVQDVLRDDHQDALATLHPPQAELVTRWIDVLEPHADELGALIGLDEPTASVALVRLDAPRTGAALVERDRSKFNLGRPTFRVPTRSAALSIGLATALVGLVWLTGFQLAGIAIQFTALIVATIGIIAGRLLTRQLYVCADQSCNAVMKTIVATCPGCGGTIARTIPSAQSRLHYLEQLELEAGDPDDGVSRG